MVLLGCFTLRGLVLLDVSMAGRHLLACGSAAARTVFSCPINWGRRRLLILLHGAHPARMELLPEQEQVLRAT